MRDSETSRAQPAPAMHVSHVAALVADVGESARFLGDLLGWGPWSIYDIIPPRLSDRVYRGTPGTFGMIGAETHIGEVDFALNQALTGPSIYEEYLRRRGYGLHHVACMAGSDGLDAVQRRFAEAGVGIAMKGRIEENLEFFYFDTESVLGVSIESGSGHAIELRPDRTADVSGNDRSAPAILAGVAVVVDDLDSAVEAYSMILGWGPWEIGAPEQSLLFDRRQEVGLVEVQSVTARALVDSLIFELVFPNSGTNAGGTIDERVAVGLHHVTCRLARGEQARVRHTLDAYGVATTVGRADDGGEVWYLDSTPRLKLAFSSHA